MKKQTIRTLLIAWAGVFLPLSAWAIGGSGTNFFMLGFYHPMMVPAHSLALFALGLLIGQQGKRCLSIILPIFLLVLAASLAMTRYQSALWDAEMVLLPLAAITGLLVVLKLNLMTAIPLIIAIVIAVVIGMDSVVPRIPGLQAQKVYLHLTGSGVFASGLLLLISLTAFALRNLLDGVVLRILGAWSTAGAVLVVTLLLVGGLTP